MLRQIVASICLVVAGSSAWADSDDEAYAALNTFTRLTSKTINSAGCLIAATADFSQFTSKIAVFRDAWLNRDYSLDFYAQRRKQVFTYIVAKRYAELLTEGLYRQANPPSCSFAISAAYDDKFGAGKEMALLTWRFDQSVNAKVNWDKIDPRAFGEVALDYKISSDAMQWMSDEPSLGQPKQPKLNSCDPSMLRANAIFIRATTHCTRKNYMDSPAGYYALAISRQCASLGEEQLKSATKAAMMELDDVVRRKGRGEGCRWVDAVERDVLRAVTN